MKNGIAFFGRKGMGFLCTIVVAAVVGFAGCDDGSPDTNNSGGKLSWTAVADSTFGEDTINGIAWGGVSGSEKFVAVGNSGKIAYSATN
jgi:hypothetical protein